MIDKTTLYILKITLWRRRECSHICELSFPAKLAHLSELYVIGQVNYSSPTARGLPISWRFGCRVEHLAKGDPPTVAKLGKLH